mmetsp:Transcript_60171/g.167892  ORF Transcript_60171/g.167892 Transcript_60171/m.167892 type:complete len:227 (+) Transcript_60171:168-848(+)
MRVILGGSREHNLLGASSQVRLNFLGRQEHASRLANVVRAMLPERNLGWVPGVRQSHLDAVNHQGIAVGLDGAVVPAMDGVVLHHVRQVVRVVTGIDEFELHLRVLHGDARNLATDTAKAIDADAYGVHGHRIPAAGLPAPASRVGRNSRDTNRRAKCGGRAPARGCSGSRGRSNRSLALHPNWCGPLRRIRRARRNEGIGCQDGRAHDDAPRGDAPRSWHDVLAR